MQKDGVTYVSKQEMAKMIISKVYFIFIKSFNKMCKVEWYFDKPKWFNKKKELKMLDKKLFKNNFTKLVYSSWQT